MRSKSFAAVMVVVVGLTFTACAAEEETLTVDPSPIQWLELDGLEFRGGEHELVEFDEPLPYIEPTEVPVDSTLVDENGLHIYEREGERYFHPVAQAQFALSMHSNWILTGEDEFLDAAEANARDIVDNTDSGNGPLWGTYDFDFPLHGDDSNTIHSPWWSAMAQGQMLSLFSRLAEATGEDEWHSAAERTFESFLEVHSSDDLPEGAPWAVFVDDQEWLWLEEYAGDVEPMRVLNGHVFAMYGLYDYWILTGSEEAQVLFNGAAETVIEFVPQLRNPGEPSWYGMRIQDNPIAQSESYHRIHVDQLAMVGHMTADERFTELSEQLRSDFY